MDWETVLCLVFLWGFEHHLNTQRFLYVKVSLHLEDDLLLEMQSISIPSLVSAEYVEIIQHLGLVRRTYSKPIPKASVTHWYLLENIFCGSIKAALLILMNR